MNKCGNLILGILTIVLLITAITQNMPYDFYNILRIVLSCISIYFAYNTYQSNYKACMIVFIIISILFNPILPITFQKRTWKLIDYGTLLYFLFYSFIINFELIKSKGDRL